MEWSNLFPACRDCNNPKGSSFPINQTRARVSSPFDAQGNLNPDRFDSVWLNHTEDALLLHPEIDTPHKFLLVSHKGEMEAIGENQRGLETIRLANLNRPNLRERRKKILDDLRADIESQILRLLRVPNPDADHTRLAYDLIFEKILNRCYDPTHEFTLLGWCMAQDFETYISLPISEKLYPNNSNLQSQIANDLTAAFKNFLQRNTTI